jgi:hypothetical protein
MWRAPTEKRKNDLISRCGGNGLGSLLLEYFCLLLGSFSLGTGSADVKRCLGMNVKAKELRLNLTTICGE